MTVTNINTAQSTNDESMTEPSMPQGELGWEGHVHVSEDLPIWERMLETWPELRTGLSYSLVFASGICLGGAIMVMMAASKNNQQNS